LFRNKLDKQGYISILKIEKENNMTNETTEDKRQEQMEEVTSSIEKALMAEIAIQQKGQFGDVNVEYSLDGWRDIINVSINYNSLEPDSIVKEYLAKVEIYCVYGDNKTYYRDVVAEEITKLQIKNVRTNGTSNNRRNKDKKFNWQKIAKTTLDAVHSAYLEKYKRVARDTKQQQQQVIAERIEVRTGILPSEFSNTCKIKHNAITFSVSLDFTENTVVKFIELLREKGYLEKNVQK